MSDAQLDFHPGMPMRWEITRSDAESFEAINWIDPKMEGPPPHTHPAAEETYEVLEGELDICVNGEWSTLKTGQKGTAPAGVPHTLRNSTDQPVKIINVHAPGMRYEAFFREMQRLVTERGVSMPPKSPRDAVYAATWWTGYPDEIRSTKPPQAVFKALALVGKVLRVKV